MFSRGKTPAHLLLYKWLCSQYQLHARPFGNTSMPLRAGTFRMPTRRHSSLLSPSGFRLPFIPYWEAAVHIHVIDPLIDIKPRERFTLELVKNKTKHKSFKGLWTHQLIHFDLNKLIYITSTEKVLRCYVMAEPSTSVLAWGPDFLGI